MRFLIVLIIVSIASCKSVSLPLENKYRMQSFSTKKYSNTPSSKTLLVTLPTFVAGYGTNRMFYVKKPYELQAFVKNAWIAPPADMFYPLLLKSLERANYFKALTSSSQTTDYRLDTQLLNFYQNFIDKQSFIDLQIKVALSNATNNKLIASHIFIVRKAAKYNDPLGGVVAANAATYEMTSKIVAFVVSSLRK